MDVWIKKLWYIHTIEYYSTKNEWNDVICNNMDDLEIESESHSVVSDSV